MAVDVLDQNPQINLALHAVRDTLRLAARGGRGYIDFPTLQFADQKFKHWNAPAVHPTIDLTFGGGKR